MKLTPLDIRKQNFRKTMRGFDPEDVRVFLDLIADEYEQLLQENGMLNEKVRHLSDQIERYHSMEKTLQNSLLTAERVSEEARERARLEAEAVVADSRQRGERILDDSRDRLRELSRQVQELHREKDLFLQRFLSFLEGQMQFLRSHENELHEIDTIDARAGDFLAATARKGRPADDLDYASATDESYLVGSGDDAPETETVWSNPPSNQDAAERFTGREEPESDLRAPIPDRGAHGERPAPRRFAAEPAGPGDGGMSRSSATGRPGVSERVGAKDRGFSAARSGQFERPSADPARESEAAQGMADGDESGFFNRRAAAQGFFERSKKPGADS